MVQHAEPEPRQELARLIRRKISRIEVLLEIGSGWLNEQIRLAIDAGRRDLHARLDAHKLLSKCRKDLVQRNANPQMVAERALLAVRRSVA